MKKYEILNANALKLIALVSMIFDHVGVMLFPETLWLRCLGRIALPVFAYMIAEGCRYTRNMKQYFLRIFILGALCQIVFFIVYKTLYLSTLISFSLSIIAIVLLKKLQLEKNRKQLVLYELLTVLLILFMLFLLYPPSALASYEIALDYGIYPFLIPIILYLIPKKKWRILSLIPVLLLLSLEYTWEQWFAFCAIPFLLMYNGRRGKTDLKYFFYIAYPAHLVLIFLVFLLTHGEFSAFF